MGEIVQLFGGKAKEQAADLPEPTLSEAESRLGQDVADTIAEDSGCLLGRLTGQHQQMTRMFGQKYLDAQERKPHEEGRHPNGLRVDYLGLDSA